MIVAAWAAAIALAQASPLIVDGYRPVRCAARMPYAGPPRRRPPAFPASIAVSNGPLPAPTAKRLDAAFDRILSATAAQAISVTVATTEGSWSRQRASVDRPALYWASAGKTFIAVVILQLVEEKRLSLDAAIEGFVPGVPNGRTITIRDLLQHSSGIYNANEDAAARNAPRWRSARENVAIAGRHGAMFCPGAAWRYSNTGYDLLGMVIEKIDGRDYRSAVEARIVRPLELTTLKVPGPGDAEDGIAPPITAQVGAGPAIKPGWPGAAGPIAGSAQDMARFWAALLGGKLLKPATVSEMFGALYPMFDAGQYYGLGVMVIDVPSTPAQTWVGHFGGAPGANAVVAYAIERRAFVAVSLTGDGSAAAAGNALLRALDEVPQL
ncbi:MAG: serine hydrolase domain-containing protein [Sphingomonas sp.]